MKLTANERGADWIGRGVRDSLGRMRTLRQDLPIEAMKSEGHVRSTIKSELR
jgi:hypothetical protein